ncbi:unnamed protein product [Larinioides sclopetarius]|uniref:Regulatory protein zeste n=1 Tax=Larinioides sclopetarius TaxID=280406 RepID=A0AAV1Z8P3_9ARAC
MDLPKLKGNIRIRLNQFEIVVETMGKNPFLNGNKLASFYTAFQRNDDWKTLTEKLNSTGGAVKNVRARQKCWTDKKGEVKKYNILEAARMKTGGGSNNEKHSSALEERILY